MVTILLRYSKKSIFGFVLGYWYRAPKTQNFPVTGVRRVSLIIHCKPFSTLPEFILTRWLLEDGTWSSEEPTMWLESPKFQYPPLPFLGRGRSLSSITNGQWLHQSGLPNATYKNPKQWHSKSSHRCWASRTCGEGMEANVPLPYPALCTSSICLFLSSTLNNPVRAFPWVLGSYRKLLNLRKELWKPLNYIASWSEVQVLDNLGLGSSIWSKVRDSLMGLSP